MFQLSYSSDYLSAQSLESVLNCLQNDMEIELQTSGSTGKPKRINYPISLLKNSANKTNAFFDLTSQSNALLCMNSETIAGKMMVVRAHQGNYSLLAINPSARPLASIHSNVDFVAMVPLQLKESLIHDFQKLKEIRIILIGGGPISNDLEKLLIEKEITVYHSFGMTETLSHIALRKVGFENEIFFHALPGIHFSTENDQLIIHAPDLGILNLETNDLVELKNSTSFRWLGRKDFVINSGGYKIHPELLENTWSEVLSIPYFISREPSEKWGEKVVMYLESEAWPEIDKEQLLLYFKPYELPKKYYLCKKFIYTPSGKINRSQSELINHIDCREETL